MSKNSNVLHSPTLPNKCDDGPKSEDSNIAIKENSVADSNTNRTDQESYVKKRHRISSPLPEISDLECLLLADTTPQCAPLHLQQILAQFDTAELAQAEILLLLVYVVALESGFITQTEYEKSSDYITKLPATTSFHSKNVLRLSRQTPFYSSASNKTRFTMKLCSIVDTNSCDSPSVSPQQLSALLTALVTGDFMIVTLTPATCTGAGGFSVCLSIGRYVLSTQARGKPLYHRFRKLDELSLVLRDRVFVPMRSQHLALLEAHVYPSLAAMPAELYDHVLQYLKANQLNIMANVNRSLHQLTTRSKHMVGR